MKKKKEKQIEKPIELGNKIRDVKINENQHFLLFVSMLVLFNIIMIAACWFLLMYLTEWWNWLICIIIVSVCFTLSFREFLHTKKFHSCTLYDNAIAINSIWFHIEVELKDIFEMQVKESVLDKMFKLNTKSLEIKILHRRRKHFTLHFIEENAVKLKQEITMLIDRANNEKENFQTK